MSGYAKQREVFAGEGLELVAAQNLHSSTLLCDLHRLYCFSRKNIAQE
jgi:hypothetical protein